MNVFIVGITGATGFRLASILKARGDGVGGLCRQPSQAETLGSIGISATLGDLVEMDVATLAVAFHQADVIVFTAGAGESDSDAMIDAVDGGGVMKSVEAAVRAKIRRFILVSVFPEAGRGGAEDRGFEHYITVKKHADVALSKADLDWVILRPSTLTNERGTGRVDLGPARIHTAISRDDVAETLAELVCTPSIRRKILELTGGSTPIDRAVAMQVDTGKN